MPTSSQVFFRRFRNSWKYILSVIIFSPLIAWLFLYPLTERLGSVEVLFRSFGQIFGIVGTLLFSFSLITSYRNQITEIIFGGLDRQYRIHHLSGMYGLFILLLHPIFLSVPLFMHSVEQGGMFFVPFQNGDAVDFGIFSILGFIFLIGMTLFGVLFSYQTLKRFHQFLGVAFLFGAVHGFMIPSDIEASVFIRVWVLGFVFLGLFSYVYYSLLKRFTVRKKMYTVSSVQKIESNISEVLLVPSSEAISHLPGQFAFFSFVNSTVVPNNEAHPFTISSWENNGNILISAKGLGDFTTLLANEVSGTTVAVEGPYGEFVYLYGLKKQVWVAGGVGVTPFVAFTEHILKQENCIYDIEFFYSVRTTADLAFNELFSRAALLFPNFKYHPMPSDTYGFITGQLLVDTLPTIREQDIFVCGPPPMMNALTTSLTNLGVKPTHIHSELFSLLK